MIKGNHTRLRQLMGDQGLDAIIAFTPLNMQYLSGYQPPSGVLGDIGAYSATFTLDASYEPGLIIGEFDASWAGLISASTDVRPLQLWVEIENRDDLLAGRTTIREKKEQFDWDQVFTHLRGVLGDRGVLGGQIACELGELPGHLRTRLETEFPGIRWKDSHHILGLAKELKTAEEIAALRRSVELSELGLRAALLDQDPRGRTASQLRNDFERAVRNDLAHHPETDGYQGSRVFLTVGGKIGPNVARDATRVTDGQVIWIDCAVTIDGYQSDIGRTIAVGQVDPLVERVAAALEAGSVSGYEALAPGVPMREIYDVTQRTIRAHGLPTYTRGHFGHAIGLGGGEHPPFISPRQTREFEAGMVFAYERPLYIRGTGGFQFEDNLVVHSDRIEKLNKLPYEMLRV